MDEREYIVTFRKPYEFEGKTYDEIDLSGMELLTGEDLCRAQKQFSMTGNMSTLPEVTPEFACIFAAMATEQPMEFFKGLPARELTRVKGKVNVYFFGSD